MSYDFKDELKRVTDYYKQDRLQKRFSALICGPSGSGKTFLLRSCRYPVHVDSFDPGGTKCLSDWIKSGNVICDTRFENEDPLSPKAFALWKQSIDVRIQIKYFDHIGTYALDSSTMWMAAAMNAQQIISGTQGRAPSWNQDYKPVRAEMETYIRKLMSLPCDFILTGHLEKQEELLYKDPKTGIERKNIEYRYMTIGKAEITVPLLFDEVYVMEGKEDSNKQRLMTIQSQGKYQARSRLKGNGKLNDEEPADIKALLKKIGLSTEDKPKLSMKEEEVNKESSQPTTIK
jgi:hypothetical protein